MYWGVLVERIWILSLKIWVFYIDSYDIQQEGLIESECFYR